MELKEIKQYCRIDYDDDDELILFFQNVVFEELADLISGFDKDNMTARQKLLVLVFVKDLYDNRDKYQATGKETMRQAVRSLLLKEMLR
ncbi:MAG: phage gp6-like head-tail connector protein [Clostridia bacterium]|nr:phage gp6-like head-tail connector protein [Clostridia bacterium]